MARSGSSLHHRLSRRLLPLAWALGAVVALIMALTWGVLQVQVTLAGFLNSESVWSKAQKQAVIDLDNYALSGNTNDLVGFKRNYRILDSDRWGRDAIIAGNYDDARVNQVFRLGNIMPAAQPGMKFLLRYFHSAPHISAALSAWGSTDSSIAQLHAIAAQLQHAYAKGTPSTLEITRQRARIKALNEYIEPRSDRFSLEVVQGAVWLGRALFWAVLLAIIVASLLWLRMARRVLERIHGSEERYHLLFDSAAMGIVMLDDSSDRILDANVQAIAWSGRPGDALIGSRFSDLFAPVETAADGRSATGRVLDNNGSERPVEVQSSHTTWGQLSVRQAIMRDISDRVAMERERRIAAEALASIAEGVIIADADRRILSINPAHTGITGYSAQELVGRCFDETRTLPDGRPLPQSLWDDIVSGHNWQGEVQNRRVDGSTYPERLSISAIRDAENQIQQYVAVFTNIFTARAQQRHLQYLATHDALTGMVNRAEFEQCCTDAIAVAARQHKTIAVLFIDLDAFKIVNDSYSHAIGDRLLTLLAERMRRQLSGYDVAGRIGGDEFTVLLGKLGMREDADAVARRLLATLSEPVVVDEYEIVLSASIGVAGYPLDGADALTLIANADAAMYAAKTEERNAVRFYTPIMHADARWRLGMATELRQALVNNEFELRYQPSVEMPSGRIVAVEALLRWRHPERGEVMPDTFIPLAESLGLIRQIDEWVLKTVIAQIQAWDAAGVPPVRVAMNVSARWFGHSAFVEGVNRALQSTQLHAQRLLLEITESAMLELGENTQRTMRALHALGVGVAIDDFGTGYSSMAYLKLPAVAYLKIDRSFVADLPHDANNAAIIEAMLAMARTLGLCSIAEGVETEAQHEFLLNAGCDEGQGYLYSYPIPAAAVERLLSPRSRHPSTKLQLVPPKRS